jgi:hypothetical protein
MCDSGIFCCCCQVEFSGTADPSTGVLVRSMAYLSVIEESQRKGIVSRRPLIREEMALLRLQLLVCMPYWYLLIPSEFQRIKGY